MSLSGDWLLQGPREIACCRCRQRKKKCDKRRPVCGECARSGAACVPLMPKKMARGHMSLQYMRRLEDHVASLEMRLRQSNPSIAGDHLASSLSSLSSPELSLAPGPDLTESIDPSDLGMHIVDMDTMDTMDAVDAADTVDTVDDMNVNVVDSLDPALLPQPSPDLMSHRLAESCLSAAKTRRYITEYFVSAHPMWPFLHHQQWQGWWLCWKERESSPTPRLGSFFVDMVLAIGSLLAHNAHPTSSDDDDLHVSHAAYRRALALYEADDALAGARPVLRTQSALLLTLYAMHVGTASDISAHAAQALAACRQQKQQHAESSLDTVIQKMALRTCTIIDILIANTMDPLVLPHSRGPMAATPLIESHNGLDSLGGLDGLDGLANDTNVSAEELRLALPEMVRPDLGDIGMTSEAMTSVVSEMMPTADDIALEEHMLQLRRIQIRILRLVRTLEQNARVHGHPVPNLWRSPPKHALDRWVEDAEQLTATASRRWQMRFKSAAWLRKLANYAVVSLFPNPALAVRGGDAKHLVAAACQVLTSFRKLRVTDHVSCYTWTALLHQFQAGVVVVVCLWATPTHLQPALYDRRCVCQALFACLSTVSDFANKWPSAGVFRDTFELLMDALPVSEFGDPSQQWTISPAHAPRLASMLVELRRLHVQERVVAMLQRMLHESRPPFTPISVEETRWIQYENGLEMMSHDV